MTSEGKCHFLANASWFTDIPEQDKGYATVSRVFPRSSYWLTGYRKTPEKDWDINCIIPSFRLSCLLLFFSGSGRDYMKVGSVMTGFPSLLQQ